ncbi:MAG: hypothetical protein KAX49_07245 [Halanaerobiales bacterium]|nr:hypothetical protein [Halanaerobiales bacterium]
MAITRSQYITEAEYTTIIGAGNTATVIEINEASEQLKSHCYTWNKISADDYDTDTAPNDLKLATAYQVKYNKDNPGIDEEYAGTGKSVTIGKTNESVQYGGSGSKEYQKISPKANRYLMEGKLIVRKIC